MPVFGVYVQDRVGRDPLYFLRKVQAMSDLRARAGNSNDSAISNTNRIALIVEDPASLA